ncbi:hypothetical protein BGX24_006632 [Mortierella sp. AD032]|nr:hypothetical protein BGX24_006632 [Mortierella sp. AD032]
MSTPYPCGNLRIVRVDDLPSQRETTQLQPSHRPRTGAGATITQSRAQIQIDYIHRQIQQQRPLSRRERAEQRREEKRQMEERRQRERILSAIGWEEISLQEKLEEVLPHQERIQGLQEQAKRLQRIGAIEERLQGIEQDRVKLDQAKLGLDEEKNRLRQEQLNLRCYQSQFRSY